MTKFKVGDKVRVRKNLRTNAFYGRTNFISEMNRMKGQIVTIKNMSSDGKSFMIEEFDYYWSPEMLEPVKEDKLIFNGNATILFKDGKKYVTRCDTSDTYDREKGLLMALAKANGYTYGDIQKMLNNATIKGKDMQVREVRRRAEVGEYVKIINKEVNSYDYKNGDILKIIDADNYVRYGHHIGQFLFDKEYVVLENYKPRKGE